MATPIENYRSLGFTVPPAAYGRAAEQARTYPADAPVTWGYGPLAGLSGGETLARLTEFAEWLPFACPTLTAAWAAGVRDEAALFRFHGEMEDAYRLFLGARYEDDMEEDPIQVAAAFEELADLLERGDP